MQVSIASESPVERLRITVAAVESLKWVGLAAMLIEHVAHYSFGMTQGWPFIVGRLAFPFFLVSLVTGCADKTLAELRSVVLRLVGWGVVAQVGCALVRDPMALNVLFTFALGVTVHISTRGVGTSRWLWAVGALACSFAVEYGALGVLAVATAMHGARMKALWEHVGWMAFSLLLICAVKFNQPTVLALPALFALNALRIELPRVRGVFYWAYAGQWPVIAALKAFV